MGQYEDLYYDISESIDKKGLRKEFQAQLEKMRNQDKHKYKEVRDKWSYAYEKVLTEYNKR
tara:strand:- start:15242 stop:15424 length:183 start_codon:yes stop_codon:yes gene_type:complete